MADVATHSARREVIRRILRTHVVGTQEDLGKLLERDSSRKGSAVLRIDVLSRGVSGRAAKVRVTSAWRRSAAATARAGWSSNARARS